MNESDSKLLLILFELTVRSSVLSWILINQMRQRFFNQDKTKINVIFRITPSSTTGSHAVLFPNCPFSFLPPAFPPAFFLSSSCFLAVLLLSFLGLLTYFPPVFLLPFSLYPLAFFLSFPRHIYSHILQHILWFYLLFRFQYFTI